MSVLGGIALVLVLGVSLVSSPQEPEPPPGMATYYVALLRRGPAWTADKTPEIAKLQEAHLAHIRKMSETGKLIAAGPFLDGGDLRGVFVFNATPEEAKALAASDPMVNAGRLALDFHPWWVAEGVMPVAGSR